MHPAVGSFAPPFTLRNQHGEAISPIGAGPALLVFYPFAFSGLCTGELQGLRDHADAFAGVEVVGISCDPMFALRVFADQEGIQHSLLSDFWPHGEVARAFGCFDVDRGAASRSSYLTDSEGRIAWSLHHGFGESRSVDAHIAGVSELFG